MQLLITCGHCGVASSVPVGTIPLCFGPMCPECGSNEVTTNVVMTWKEYLARERSLAEVREQADMMIKEAQRRGL